MTEVSRMKARWDRYFERLYQADPPAVDLDVRGVTIPIADTPTNCDPPSFVETNVGEPVETVMTSDMKCRHEGEGCGEPVEMG